MPSPRVAAAPLGPLLGALVLAWVGATALVGPGCNSDDKGGAQGTTGTTGPLLVSATEVVMESTSTTTGPAPDVTCRGAIQCLINCLLSIPMPFPDEPDLSCIPACDMGLNAQEARDVLRLAECVGQSCIADGMCQEISSTTGGSTSGGSTTGGSSGSSGGSSGSSGGSTSTTGQDPGALCQQCILLRLTDVMPPGCEAQAQDCS